MHGKRLTKGNRNENAFRRGGACSDGRMLREPNYGGMGTPLRVWTDGRTASLAAIMLAGPKGTCGRTTIHMKSDALW
jgi:hypothetical protein